MWERWVERVRFWPSFICAHLSPSFSSFLFLPFLCHLSRGKGRVLCGRHLGWMGAERACTEKSGWTGASWQGSLTDASWCLNPLRVRQRQQAGWLSVTVQLPLEPKAQWQSGTSLHAMAFCLPFPSLVLPLPSSILVFIFHLRYCEQESIYLNTDSFDKGQGKMKRAQNNYDTWMMLKCTTSLR